MSVDIYFRQYWTDNRLTELYDHQATLNNVDSNSSSSSAVVQLRSDYADLLWVPDLYWVDAVKVWKPGVLSGRGENL